MTETPAHRSDDIAHHDTPEDEAPLRRRIHLTNLVAGSNWLLLNTDRETMAANGPALRAMAGVIEALHEIGWHLNQPDATRLATAQAHLDAAQRELRAALEGH
ncbi:hypothetical protein [Streptacidiphilus jiangxiensis]|uniref:Uncharacterized protein n=1 Tax=Streptacidiphilus jiangxiensis TaxID=235985 RepID=A0A1H7Y7P5_STRJI|nr:hypothetical protein [Streptacidiphilus jiangxiensis]SEM41955.1 hypothetical protein SAMN05414137_12739 [Streptacidiphilus jiangxiensis]